MIPASSGPLPPAVPVLYAMAASNLLAWGSAAHSLGAWSGRLLTAPEAPARAVSDGARWLRAMTDRGRPSWASPNTVVRTTPLTRLRDFSTDDGDVVPTLVLPPQAGHDSCIVDFSRSQSQMQVLRAAGLTRLYALEWLGATQATRRAGIEDYVDEVAAAVDLAGGRVNLVGDCQGGWLATIYAALHPERVHTLTIAGAPIDFHVGSGSISDWVQLLTRGGSDMTFYEALVASGGGVLKGEHMVGGFVAIRPENEVSRQLQLLAHLDDAEHLDRYRAFEDWFKHTQDIAGDFYLWIVEHLFARNELVRGEARVGGRLVDLSRITCPVGLLAGDDDHITPPEQVFALADAVGTPAADVTRHMARGGHLGLFMGRQALGEDWPALMAPVVERSRAGVGRDVAERRGRAAVVAGGDVIPLPA